MKLEENLKSKVNMTKAEFWMLFGLGLLMGTVFGMSIQVWYML